MLYLGIEMKFYQGNGGKIMRHRWKRGAAVLLTASMLFSNISITGLAEEDVATQAAEETQAET